MGACSSDGDTTGGGAPSAGSPLFSSECGTCVANACGAEMWTCQTDPGCASYLDCLLRCPVDAGGVVEPTCEQSCPISASSETEPLETAFSACRFYGPGEGCGRCAVPPLPDPLNQTCESRPEPAPTPCRQCYWDHCCQTWDACYAEGVNPDCDALASCIMACDSPFEPCASTCFDAYPGSVTTLLAQQSCGLSVCAADQRDCDASLRDPCETCLYVDCADSFVTLLSTGEGYLAWLCMSDCGALGAETACVEACVSDHPGAEAAVSLWAQCIEYRCAIVC
jgi:hypothetical protein